MIELIFTQNIKRQFETFICIEREEEEDRRGKKTEVKSAAKKILRKEIEKGEREKMRE